MKTKLVLEIETEDIEELRGLALQLSLGYPSELNNYKYRVVGILSIEGEADAALEPQDRPE